MILSKEENDAMYEFLRVQIFLHKHFKKHRCVLASDLVSGLDIPYERAREIISILEENQFIGIVPRRRK